MITWQLWRALRNPPLYHPLFARISQTAPERIPWQLGCLAVLMGPVVIFLAFLWIGTMYSMLWAVRIGSSLISASDDHTYDLISLFAPGRLGATLMICLGCIYQDRGYLQVQSAGPWVIRILFNLPFFLLLASAGLFQPFTTTRNDVLFGFVQIAYPATLVIAIYVDHAQSIVIGCLLGMLAPTFVSNRLDASLLSVGGFVLIQLSTYAAALFTGLYLLPRFYSLLSISGWLADTSTLLVALLVFYLTRETIIQHLWRLLAYRVNADRVDIEQITGINV